MDLQSSVSSNAPSTHRVGPPIGFSLLEVKNLDDRERFPKRSTLGNAALDVHSLSSLGFPLWSRDLVPLGFAVIFLEGTYERLASRIGLEFKKGLEVGAGVIDSDDRGEVHALLFNRTDQEIVFPPGERLAQLLVEKI